MPAANLLNVLGVANGDVEVAWKAIFDATAPAAVGTAAAGTALTAAHRDHVHAPLAFTGARAYLAAVLGTTVSDVSTLVHLDTESYDVGSNFDKTTSHAYTVPVSGYYYVAGSINYNAVSDGCLFRIYILGGAAGTTELLKNYANSSLAGGAVTVSVSGILHLDANDVITMNYRHNDATTIDILGTTTFTYLNIVLITPD